MVCMVKVNGPDQLLETIRRRSFEASQISSFPKDQRATEGLVVQHNHRNDHDEAQLRGIFLWELYCYKTQGNYSMFIYSSMGKSEQFNKIPYCYEIPHPYSSLFHIAIERMECFHVNAVSVWISCLVRDIAFQIIPLVSNPLQNLDKLAKTEIFTNPPFKRGGSMVPCWYAVPLTTSK